MSETITFLGRRTQPRSDNDVDRLLDDVDYEVVDEIQSVSARDAVEEVSFEPAPDDVVEIQDVDGFTTFRRADSMLADAGDGDVRAAETAVHRAATRDGLGRVASVRRARVSLPDEVVAAADQIHELLTDAARDRLVDMVIDPPLKLAASKITEWVDRPAKAGDEHWHDKPKPRGMYRIGPDVRLTAPNKVADGDLPKSAKPYLLLIHGTFSHTEAGFAGIRGVDFSRFTRMYGDRIIALEHATLGLTPSENAVMAADLLPDGAKLHIISHSRGGLVGEALSLAAAEAWPGTSLYEQRDQEDHPDVAALGRLRELVKGKEIEVTRFARVACPARGTTLASRRIDRYASYLFNALNMIPAVGASGVAAVVKKLLLALLDKRSDPRLVPGIEAMMPESTFVALLNTAPSIDDGMAAISGDVEARGILHRLKVFGADLFYRGDHDFVVNTTAMAGGVPRTTARQAFYRGPEVVHSAYFMRAATRRAVIRWLEAEAGDDVDEFVAPGGPPIVSRARQRSTGVADAGTVVVVPDVFGTVLARNNEPVWPAVRPLVGSVARVLEAATQVTGELAGVYDPLIEHLGARFAVQTLAYDWRERAEDTAAHVAARLREILDDAAGPVHVVALGGGGLRVLAAYASTSSLPAGVKTSGGRTLLLSPPVDGSWRMASVLSGHHELAAQLALVDPVRDAEQIGAVLAAAGGLAELVPEGAPFDDEVLDAGRRLRQALATDGSGCVVLFGSGVPTISGWSSDDDRYLTTAGDGYTTVAAERLAEATVRHAPMPYAHLLVEPRGLAFVSGLLSNGTSEGLLRSAPVAAVRSGEFRPAAHRVDFPTDADIADAALDLSVFASPSQRDAVSLAVVHGDLQQVEGPVLVGVYDGTPIGGAEQALDRQFDGAIRDRLALGQLAGPLGSADVIGPDSSGAAGVVIGMGNPGDLSANGLAAGVTNGIVKLALALRDADSDAKALTVSAVLVGAGSSGGLPAPVSLTSVVNGVHRANRSLADADLDVRVEALQIIELYEDRAIEAAEAAIALARQPSADGATVVAEQILLDGCGGRPGLPPPDYQSDAWRTVRVVAVADADPDDDLVDLSFTSLGRSARAEQRVTTTQREIISALIEQSVAEPRPDPQLYNTLYELLIPRSMKTHGPEDDNLMFVVDEHASTLPLELLGTRAWTGDTTPLAVTTGLLRRLETNTFRQIVRPAAGHRALVIGDPAVAPPLPRLAGARDEARSVAETLRAVGYDVTELISADGDDQSVTVTRVMNALFAHDYRIIHIAAHGEYESPTRNGVLLGDGVRLSAAEVGQMRSTPDLVFLNACHIGSMLLRSQLDPDVGPDDGAPAPRTDQNESGDERSASRTGRGESGDDDAPRSRTNRAGRLASSIARQLINDGVRAVVAAGWAVDDAAAAAFATEFYRRLLGTDDLGTATHGARAAIYRNHPHVNTWGAYQVYGPPAMRIHAAKAGTHKDHKIVSRKRYREGLDALQREANNAKDIEVDDTWMAVNELVRVIPEHWRGGAEVAVEASIAFTLGRYDDAIERYHTARSRWDGELPLQAVEQLANAYAKYAVQLRGEAEELERQGAADDGKDANDGDEVKDGAATATEKRSDATRYDRDAEKLIDAMLVVGGETPERLAMKGSFWRRRAAVYVDPSQALREARDAYHEAAELHLDRRGSPDFYTGLNAALLDWLVAVRGSQPIDELDLLARIEECRADADARPCSNFWTRSAGGDALLLAALVNETVAPQVDEIVAAYRDAAAPGASRRQRLSIVEHVDIIITSLRTAHRKPEVVDALTAIRARLHPDTDL